jgi:hypothetical protein
MRISLNAFWLFALLSVCQQFASGQQWQIVPQNSKDFAHLKGMDSHIVASAKSDYGGTNLTAELRWSEVKDSPPWSGDEKPPIPPKEAGRLAEEFLRHELPDELSSNWSWHLSQIGLKRFGGWDCWFYEVKLVHLANGSNYNPPAVTVFVTMGGKVSPLRKT